MKTPKTPIKPLEYTDLSETGSLDFTVFFDEIQDKLNELIAAHNDSQENTLKVMIEYFTEKYLNKLIDDRLNKQQEPYTGVNFYSSLAFSEFLPKEAPSYKPDETKREESKPSGLASEYTGGQLQSGNYTSYQQCEIEYHKHKPNMININGVEYELKEKK